MAELQYRYPGLEPFNTHQEALFFGRSADRDALYELVELHQQVLLYAKSGLGKSSLINAGLVPKLLEENAKRSQAVQILPVRIGAWVSQSTTSPLDAVLEALKGVSQAAGTVPQSPFYLERIASDEASLWWHFKAHAARYDVAPIYYLLFDQFEELFSHPQAEVYAFKMQLADLLYRIVPQHLRFILEMKQAQNPTLLNAEELHALYQPLRIKVLYAIREDRYSELNRLTDQLPDFFQHRFQLAALGRAQAKEAIVAPAALDGDYVTDRFEYSPEALTKILDYLTSNAQQTVETTQLQILCSHIEQLRKPLIAIEDVPEFDNIFLQFYLDSIAALDVEVRDNAREFIEDYMIIDGQRIAHHRLACQERISMPAIDFLLKVRHLFRAERSSTGETLEIAHDTLIAPILIAKKQRDAEEELMAKAEAAAYEAEERARKEQAEREANERIAAEARREAEIARREAEITKLEARREAEIAKLEAEAARLQAESEAKRRELEEQKLRSQLERQQLELQSQLEREQLERENQEKVLANELAAREKDKKQLRWSRLAFLVIAMLFVASGVLGWWAYRLKVAADVAANAAENSKNEAEQELSRKKKLAEAFYFYEDSLALASNGDKFGYVDKEGKIVIGYQFLEANNFQDPGYAVVKNDSGKALVDMDGHQYPMAERPEDIRDDVKAILMTFLPYAAAKAKVFNNENIRILDLADVIYQGRSDAGMNMPEVWEMKNLVILSLETCSLNLISPKIGQMDSLRRLSLVNNGLKGIPEEIGMLKRLSYLDLRKNAIDSIPYGFRKLTNLRVLDLSSNAIKMLPESMRSMRQLRQFKIDGNLLSAVPKWIGDLPKLTRLSMRDNRIKTIAGAIGKLPNLEYLDLMGNELRSLPIEMGGLGNLRTLNLARNHFGTFPEELLMHDKLRELTFSHNAFSSLPDSIGHLANLRTLDLGHNALSALPPDIRRLRLLQSLDLDSNQLKTVPLEIWSLMALSTLNLSRNQLTSLPPEIGRLRNLRSLSVDENLLDSIPREIGKLSSLESLNLGITFKFSQDREALHKNRLKALPPEIGNLKLLRHLGLAGNQLTSLPDEFGGLTALVNLDLDDNGLLELPAVICKITSLTTLYLEGNQLTKLPASISNLRSLSYLVLSNNNFQSLPEELSECRHLEKLLLKGNPCAATEKDREAIRKQVKEWLPNCTVYF